MNTRIINTYRRHMRWPIVAPGQPLFVIGSDPELLTIARWAYRKKRTGWIYDIQRATIEGQMGVLIEARAIDEIQQTIKPVQRIGQALVDWSLIEPGTTWQKLVPDFRAANALARSARRWSTMTGTTLVPVQYMRPGGVLFIAYRPPHDLTT